MALIPGRLGWLGILDFPLCIVVDKHRAENILRTSSRSAEATFLCRERKFTFRQMRCGVVEGGLAGRRLDWPFPRVVLLGAA